MIKFNRWTLYIFAMILCVSVSCFASGSFANDKGVSPETLLEASETLPENPDAPLAITQGYKLNIDDVLHINIYEEQELSGDYKVGPTGMVTFPLVGDVIAEGQTVKQFEANLSERLSDGFLVDPNITVSLKSQKPFYILGEVRAPGSYGFVSNMNVLNAVAIAGGFTYRADRKEVKILRQTGPNISSEYKQMSVQSDLKPGDIILVKERFF